MFIGLYVTEVHLSNIYSLSAFEIDIKIFPPGVLVDYMTIQNLFCLVFLLHYNTLTAVLTFQNNIIKKKHIISSKSAMLQC